MKIFNTKMGKKWMSRASRERGAAVITAIIFFVIISVTVAVGLASPVVNEYKTVRDFEKSKGAYYLSEAGHEDVIYRIKNLIPTDAQETLSLGADTVTTTITVVNPNKKTVDSVGSVLGNTRRIRSTITTGTGESFVYGVWVGAGGVEMKEHSMITGNLFSAGPVCGSGTFGSFLGIDCYFLDILKTNPAGVNTVTGTVLSTGTTGANGTIKRIANQNGSAMFSGTIRNSQISGYAYCNDIHDSSTSTCQTLPEMTPADLPITAEEIENWEDVAAAGGTVTCGWHDGEWNYRINSSRNFGPKKVPCDLLIDGGDHTDTLTLQGPVWVDGDIDIEDHMNIRVDPTFTGQSIALIADEHDDPHDGGKIKITNNDTEFNGAPGGNSWVMLLSENDDASHGGNDRAIDLIWGTTGDLILYSRLGNIRIGGHTEIDQVTGYKLTLEDFTNIIYSTGLQNAFFTSGPSGAWSVQDWGE